MYTNDNRTFEEKLAIGNDKEDLLVDIFNLSMVPAKLNNEENVKDIDILLTRDNMYIDSKYQETPFFKSQYYVNILPERCLTIQKRHVETYARKEKETGKRVWVAFLVDYKQFGIYEYRFFPNSYLMYCIKNDICVRNEKLHVDKNMGRTMYQFLKYIEDIRVIKN